MFASIYIFFLFAVVLASGEESSSDMPHFKCQNGTVYHRVRLSTYYCLRWLANEDERRDVGGEIMKPLQEYLKNGGKYVTVAGYLDTGIPYGTKICIEELNEHFRRRIPLEIRDGFSNVEETSAVPDYSILTVCINDEIHDSIRRFFSRYVTIHVY